MAFGMPNNVNLFLDLLITNQSGIIYCKECVKIWTGKIMIFVYAGELTLRLFLVE